MRLLLDTHALLWCLSSPEKLTSTTREMIVDPLNEVFVSAATIWEIGIKQALGKLRIPDDLAKQLKSKDFGELPITFKHARRAGDLPMIHRDPFDRMLVAQAQEESLAIVTHDNRFESYGVQLLR